MLYYYFMLKLPESALLQQKLLSKCDKNKDVLYRICFHLFLCWSFKTCHHVKPVHDAKKKIVGLLPKWELEENRQYDDDYAGQYKIKKKIYGAPSGSKR